MSADIPRELVEQFARGNGVLFVGTALSMGAGLPGWDALLAPLADSIRLPQDRRADLPKVAQHYETARRRQALIAYLQEQTDTTGRGPTENHRRLARLGARTWVTTNYDDLIEQTLREAGERFKVVVRDQDLPYVSADAVTLLKLHGDRGQPDTFVITEQDYRTYFRRFPRVKDKLTGLLLEKTFLFVGYKINDPDFNQLRAETVYDLSQHTRMAYAILFDVDEFTVAELRAQNVQVISITLSDQALYSERLGELLDRLVNQVNLLQRQRNHDIRDTVIAKPVADASDVHGLLEAMGYRICDSRVVGADIYFLCEAKWGAEIRQEVVHFVGEAPTASDIAALNDTVVSYGAGRGLLLTHYPLPASLRDLVRQRERLQCYTLEEFTDRLADFRPYLERLIADYEASEIPQYYVPLSVEAEIGEDREPQVFKPIESFMDVWLSEPGRNHLSILGDFGSGKTWFCRRYAYLAAKRHLADPTNNRIPILVTLRDYSRAYNVEQLITDAIANRYQVGLAAGYKTFAQLNASGRLLLIYDGFDEMERRVSDYRTTVDNFWELARIVCPSSKVILTCRTAYFRHRAEEEEILTPKRRRLSVVANAQVIDLRDRHGFQVLRILDFAEEDIKLALQKRLPLNWEPVYHKINALMNLRDLVTRPVLLDMVVTTLPELEDTSQVNQATLYKAYVDTLLRQRWNEDADYISPSDRLFFIQELAWEMYESQRLSIPFSEFPQRVTDYFGLRNDPQRAAFFERDIRTQSYLIRDDTGNYRFAHKSFMEYFVARKMADIMHASNKNPSQLIEAWKTQPLTPEVQGFLVNMISERETLWRLLEATRDKRVSEVGYAGGNATRILSAGSGDSTYGSIDLSNAVVLAGDFAGKDLRRANLGNAILRGTDFTASDLSEANLREADLSNCRLTFARLVGADMTSADLGGINLHELDQVRDVAFSPDGKRIAVAAANEIRLIDLDTGRIVASVRHSTYFRCVAFHPKTGHIVAGASDGTVKAFLLDSLLELAHAQLLKTVYGLCFDQNGDEVLVTGVDGECVIATWPSLSTRLVPECSARGKMRAALFSRNNEHFIVGGHGSPRLEIFSRSSGKRLRVITACGRVLSLSLSSDGHQLACGGGDGRIRVLDFLTGACIAEWVVEERSGEGRWIWDVQYAPDDQRIVSDGPGRTVTIWDTQNGNPIALMEGHSRRVSSISINPEGTLVASGSIDGTVRIWHIGSGMEQQVFRQEVDCRGLKIKGVKSDNEFIVPFLVERGATRD